MLRKIKAIDPKEFADVEDIQKITLKGEMRKLYEEINRKLAVGWSAKDLVDLLDRQGLSMSVELFRVYLRDLDIEHGYKRSVKKFSSPQSMQTATPAVDRESVKVVVPSPNSLAQIAAQEATKKGGIKTLSLEEIKNLSQQEFDVSDYQ